MREPLPVDVDEHAASPDAHSAAVQRHEAGELRDALAGLPAQQREAILLREVRGFSYQEVAAALSVTTSAVESLLFRARRSLQTRLQEVLAGLSLGQWVQPLRELAVRLAGGGLVGPAAVKVAAVGLGTAVVAGGALDGPRVLGLGHAPMPDRHSLRAAAHRPLESAASKAPATFWPTRNPSVVVTDVHLQSGERTDGGDSGSRPEPSDRQSTPGAHEGERSTDATDTTGTVAGDGSSASGSVSAVADGGGTHQVASTSTEDSSSDSGGSSPDAAATASSSGPRGILPGARWRECRR